MLIVRALYATENTRLPFYATLLSSALAIVAALLFHMWITTSTGFQTLLETLMRLKGVEGVEVLALPLGYSSALIIQSIVLVLLARFELMIRIGTLLRTLGRGLVAAFAAGFCAYTTLNFYATGIEADTLMTVFLQGLFASFLGGVGALIAYYLLGSPELKEAYTAIHRKFFQSPPVGPQDEDALSL
jgi:peptidoglycan biosynthesis protein MviN/MurJ (putative lipid II flippase)